MSMNSQHDVYSQWTGPTRDDVRPYPRKDSGDRFNSVAGKATSGDISTEPQAVRSGSFHYAAPHAEKAHQPLPSHTHITPPNSVDNPGVDLADPKVWGPHFWFVLHNGTASYPRRATPIAIGKMVGFIEGIPTMLPCGSCTLHAEAFIDSKRSGPGGLEAWCAGRDTLHDFLIEFHNSVNERQHKDIKSKEAVIAMYTHNNSASKH